MSAKPQIIGIDGVMDWFDRYATSPYFAVYTFLSPSKLDKCFQYTKPDLDEGRTLLENTLVAMQQQDDQTLYVLKIYNGLNKRHSLDTNMEHECALRFRVVDIPNMHNQVSGVEKPNWAMQNAMAKMMETQNLILAKLSADEMEDNEPEEKQPMNGINGILNSPEMAGLIVGYLGKILGVNASQPAGMAGIEDAPDPNEAIMILNNLMNKGVTIDHLRKLDEMSNVKLQSLLLML